MILLFFIMSKESQSFGKAEHLCGITTINTLFEKGRSRNFHFLRIIYLAGDTIPGIPPVRILISVPKRIFKKAVTRNLIKRRIREAYRRNKSTLFNALEKQNQRIDLAILWTGKEVLSYHEITEALKEIIERLSQQKQQ